MKIVLDLTKLVRDGKLTPAQAEDLKLLAARDTGLLAINILMAFGTIAVAAGVLFLVPSLPGAAAIALALVAGGLVLSYCAGPQWTILGTATVVVGTLWLGGVGISYADGRWPGFAFATAICLAGTVAIRSSLLSALTALALAATLGSSTVYETATYILIIREPTLTIVCFGLLAWGTYLIANRCRRITSRRPWCLHGFRWSWSISVFGSARYGVTILEKAGYGPKPKRQSTCRISASSSRGPSR